jgi:hypothetical protein
MVAYDGHQRGFAGTITTKQAMDSTLFKISIHFV